MWNLVKFGFASQLKSIEVKKTMMTRSLWRLIHCVLKCWLRHEFWKDSAIVSQWSGEAIYIYTYSGHCPFLLYLQIVHGHFASWVCQPCFAIEQYSLDSSHSQHVRSSWCWTVGGRNGLFSFRAFCLLMRRSETCTLDAKLTRSIGRLQLSSKSIFQLRSLARNLSWRFGDKSLVSNCKHYPANYYIHL